MEYWSCQILELTVIEDTFISKDLYWNEKCVGII